MADIYIGDFGKKGEYFNLQTNCEDHKTSLNFDGSKFLLTDDALLVGLHVTSIEGINKKSTITFPNFVLLTLHRKAYEYESFVDGKKAKATIEPTSREKLLISYLTSEDSELNFETNQGKGGYIQLGSSANDLPILNGEGNAKKHSRFVVEFDDDIKAFDMSADNLALDKLASGTSGKSYSKPQETEAQRIAARKACLESLLADLGLDVKQSASNQVFIVHASLLLGLPVPTGINYDF